MRHHVTIEKNTCTMKTNHLIQKTLNSTSQLFYCFSETFAFTSFLFLKTITSAFVDSSKNIVDYQLLISKASGSKAELSGNKSSYDLISTPTKRSYKMQLTNAGKFI